MQNLIAIIGMFTFAGVMVGCVKGSGGGAGLHGGTGIGIGAPSGPTSPTIGEFVCVYKDAASQACPTSWALTLPGDPPPTYTPVTNVPPPAAVPLDRFAHTNYTLSFSVPAGSSYTAPATITNLKIVGEKRTTVTVFYQ